MVKSDPEAGNRRGWGDLSGELTSPSKTPRKKRKSVKARGKEETKRVDDGLWGFVFLFFWLSLFFFFLFPALCSLFLARSLSLSLSRFLSISPPSLPAQRRASRASEKRNFERAKEKKRHSPPISLSTPRSVSLSGVVFKFFRLFTKDKALSRSHRALRLLLLRRERTNRVMRSSKRSKKTAAKVRVVMSSNFIVPKVFSRIFSLSSFSPFPVPALASPHTAAPLACLSLDPPLLDEDEKPDAAEGGGGHWGLDAPPFPPPKPKCCCCW